MRGAVLCRHDMQPVVHMEPVRGGSHDTGLATQRGSAPKPSALRDGRSKETARRPSVFDRLASDELVATTRALATVGAASFPVLGRPRSTVQVALYSVCSAFVHCSAAVW